MADVDLRSYFESKQAEMLAVIEELVSHETPSDDKARLDAFAKILAARMRAAGGDVEILPQAERGDHVRIRYGHDRFAPGTLQALILCHYDTVWPVGSLATHPFRVDAEGKAYGPGIFDMQSSLMLCEFALHAVRDLTLELPCPLTILITSDEEIGSRSSRQLIEEESGKAAYALVMESPLPGGILKTERKGSGNFDIKIRGHAAHAGVEPERGISALHELAHQILALHALADPEKGTTVSVGVAQGGTKTNVIPAEASASVDLRAWTQEEIERVVAGVYALQPVLPGAKLSITGGASRPPLERSVTGEIFERAREIGAGIGLDLQEGATGGGSDASWPALLDVPTLDGLGVPGHGAHADHEHIEVDQIAGRAALLVALLLEL